MRIVILFSALLLGIAPATAQTSASPAARAGGLGGLLGGALPNVGAVGAGNAAGLLGYCLKNNLLGAGAGQTAPAADANGARSVLERLTGQQGVQSSPGYQAGQAGQVQTPGRTVALDGLGGRLRTQVCNVVLNRARSFL